jgi:aspartyl-tRNA(Asn)/glutamyl-tRNA(Gln) amidotransferase subunit A
MINTTAVRLFCAGLVAGCVQMVHAGVPEQNVIVELTVQQAQDAMREGRLSARQLAQASLARIAEFNPGYNAIITPNPQALAEAEAIDRRRAAGEVLGPLAGIPIVVKDTVDMAGLPTTAGWAPLSARAGGFDLLPERDAPVLARLRAAGVVVLGKTNVPVFSGSSENANDSWAGPTYNAAAPAFAPGGSSSGSATAVAASFAMLGLAEETGGSIQCPAANQALAGIKPSFGLVPNTGVVPLAGSTRDVLGPIARNVRDAALMLDAIAGYTPEDPKTVAALGKRPAQGYAAGLEDATLQGVRLGTYGPGWVDLPLPPETQRLYKETLASVLRQGAELVEDPFAGSGFAAIAEPRGEWRYDARGQESVAHDLQDYLAALGRGAAVHSLAELRARTGKDPFARDGVMGYMYDYPAFLAALADPARSADLGAFVAARERYLALFAEVMDRHRLDALLFPQAIGPPQPLHSKAFNDLTTVSQVNIGGFPAVTVPAAYYASGAPFAVIFVGRMWDEARLVRVAHAFEQAMRARRAPELSADPAAAAAKP